MPRSTFTGFVDANHRRIYADSWLHLRDYSFDRVPEWFRVCFIWRVAGFSRRCLKLEGHGVPAEVEMVHEAGKYLLVFQPSLRARLSDYPEEWGWWQGAGWNILLADSYDGEVSLRGQKGNGSLFISLPAESAQDPEAVRRWLQHALFAQVHPIKANKMAGPDGYFPQSEVDAMVRRLRRADR